MATKIVIEEKNKHLVALASASAREEADANAYETAAVVKAVADLGFKSMKSESA